MGDMADLNVEIADNTTVIINKSPKILKIGGETMDKKKMIDTAYDTMKAAMQITELPNPNKDKIIRLQLQAFQLLSKVFIAHCSEKDYSMQKIVERCNNLEQEFAILKHREE
jgi:hypothetical protein